MNQPRNPDPRPPARMLVLALVTLGFAGSARAQTPQPSGPGPVSHGPAAPTVAAAPKPGRALVVHVPPIVAARGQPIELEAMLDAPFAEEKLGVRWRSAGETEWHDVAFVRSSAGGWFASLPGTNGPGVEYYISGRDASGAEVLHFASPDAPHLVRVDPTIVDRLETLDRDRLAGHTDQVAIEVFGHNFGNRFDIPDRFVRAELGYTHRVWRVLHQISFGFGSIGGKTPLISEVGGDAVAKSLRYGYGEVRLRPHPAVFVDMRASLGVSHEGFDQGLRGQLTFGRPWRSCLQIGAEELGDLGASGWVRLQWDTAPPFLMGASVMRTDLPGATVDFGGLYLGYDVAYTIANRFTVKALLSYGSRDGAANFGGGLGSAIDF